MTTIRIAKRSRERFLIVDRRALGDERLSFRARGLLAFCLSKPDNWVIDSTQLARHGKEGREATRTALNELREFGYLVTTKRQNAKGQWITESVLYEYPPEIGSTEDGFPGVGSSDVGLPGALMKSETEDCTEDLKGTPKSKNRAADVLDEVCRRRQSVGVPIPADVPAAVKVIRVLLTAGWPVEALVEAADRAPTISVRSVEIELDRANAVRSAPYPYKPWVPDDGSPSLTPTEHEAYMREVDARLGR